MGERDKLVGRRKWCDRWRIELEHAHGGVEKGQGTKLYTHTSIGTF